MLHKFCEQEKTIGLQIWPFEYSFLDFCSFYIHGPFFSFGEGHPFRKESGDPEQIKAALEEAKRAGADEASGNGPVGDVSFRFGVTR